MHILKTEAIIIKRRNIGEADRILTVFTNNYGKLQIKAKGVRKITSKRSSHIELLNIATLTFYKGRFPVLIEAQSMENFAVIKQDLKKIGIAYHVCELIDGLCPENQEQQDIFFLLKDILIKLNEQEHLEKYVYDFQLALLAQLGYWSGHTAAKNFKTLPFIENILERKLKARQILPYLL